jgi:hypothetical protein
VRSYKLLVSALTLILSLSTFVLPQNPEPIGIRPEPPQGKIVVALRAARLIDGTGAPMVKNAIVIITNNRISVVGDATSVRIPSGVKVIDLGDVTLLPGFIDAHTHLIGRVLGDPEGEMSSVRDYQSFGAILGVLHARDTLMAGFTSVRNVGASGQFDDMALRKAINEAGRPGHGWRRRATRLGSLAVTVTKTDSGLVCCNWVRWTAWPMARKRFAPPFAIKSNTAPM